MKKTLSIISIVLVAAMISGVFGAISVNAADPSIYTASDVTAYIFSLESEKTLKCLFRDDLPDVPYINPEDYLNVVYLDPFTETRGDDGIYTVTNAYGFTMEIDAGNDTVHLTDYDAFSNCNLNQEGSSLEIKYIKAKDYRYSAEPSEVTLDLAAYRIDIAEDDGRVYLPLTVITAMFSITYINATYFEGSIYFVHTMDPEGYQNDFDESSLYQKLTRSQEMAEFNYYTLCLSMDKFYGLPSNALLASGIAEKGLDKTLDEYDEMTPYVKQLLLSTDMVEYFNGLVILTNYLNDGGHTVIYYPAIIGASDYNETPLISAWTEVFLDENNEQGKTAYEYYMQFTNDFSLNFTLYGIRNTEYEKYQEEIVKVWESGAYLIIHGDIAVFVFDSFEIDTPYEFKEALDIASENGIKNFLLDDSCNSGGYVAAYQYICAIITNEKYRASDLCTANMNPLTGSVIESVNSIDLNLDGSFDEADSDVFYDFNFAILTSDVSFSCGNELPTLAKQLGVMILGEPSGGGSCCITERYLADGFYFTISDIMKSCLPDGADVDLGAPTDYDLRVLNEEDGSYDYKGFYDLDHISELMSGFYKTVTFVDNDGNVILSGRYREGDEIIVPEPVRAKDNKYEYNFIEWDKDIETVCRGDAVYTASFEAVQWFFPGDVSGDGEVDNKDVVTLFRYLSGEKIDVNVEALDVNGDGYVDNKDVVTLFRFLSGDKNTVISEIPYVPAEAETDEAA